jgi:hypothetical protein
MMSDADRIARDELATQFLHADLSGTLSGELALRLADVALSWCRGHQPAPPADFDRDDPDPYSAVPDR